MIVKRLEKNGVIKSMYSSSTICGSIYDTTNKELVIIFNNGGQYKYPNVSETDYFRLETADSNGSTFNTHIKKKYTNFEKLDPIPEVKLKMILKEISDLKEVEAKPSKKAKTKSMLESMNILIGSFLVNGSVDNNLLTKVETSISEFKKSVSSDE